MVIGVSVGVGPCFLSACDVAFIVPAMLVFVLTRPGVVDIDDVAVVMAVLIVAGEIGGAAWNREAANGGAGHVDSTASDQFFSVALKAVKGDGDGFGLLRLQSEK